MPEETLEALDIIKKQLDTDLKQIPKDIQTAKSEIVGKVKENNKKIGESNIDITKKIDTSKQITDRFKRLFSIIMDIVPEDNTKTLATHENNKKELNEIQDKFNQDISVLKTDLNLGLAEFLKDLDTTRDD